MLEPLVPFEGVPAGVIWHAANPDVDRSGPPAGKKKPAGKKAPAKKPGRKKG